METQLAMTAGLIFCGLSVICSAIADISYMRKCTKEMRKERELFEKSNNELIAKIQELREGE